MGDLVKNVVHIMPLVRRAKTLAAAGQAVAHSFREVQPQPGGLPGEWPKWAQTLKAQRIEGETGIGDTVKRILGQTGETFSELYQRMTGADCGCVIRQKVLNLEFPYRF